MNKQTDILNYSPDLNIYSAPSSNIIGNNKTHTLSSIITDTYSTNNTLNFKEFVAQSPSIKVSKAQSLISNISLYMSNIESKIVSNDYFTKYITSESDAKTLKSNSEDMKDGSTLLEVYSILNDIKKEVQEVLDLYITCMFGNNTDYGSVSEIVSSYIDRINQMEASNDYNNINYFNLYYDTQVSSIFGDYIDRISEICAELSFIQDKQRELELTPENTSLFKNAFDKLNTSLSYNQYSDSISSSNICISLKNFFLLKQQLNSYLETFATLYKLSDGIDEIQEIKKDKVKELENKLENFIKTSLYSGISKNDILTILQKKSKYRSFFIS